MPLPDKAFKFVGHVLIPCSVIVWAATVIKAEVRAMLGDFDALDECNDAARTFNVSDQFEALEIPSLRPKRNRFRAIFRETAEYAVEFWTDQTREQLLDQAMWRDAVDMWNTSRGIDWQHESTTNVTDVVLEHLEQLPSVDVDERARVRGNA